MSLPFSQASGNSRGSVVVTSTPADASFPVDGATGEDTRLATLIQRMKNKFKMSVFARKLPMTLAFLFFGYFVATCLPHPQSPTDVFVAIGIIGASEVVNKSFYGRRGGFGFAKFLQKHTWIPACINNFKLGVLYGLFTDGFKVGS